MKKIISIFMILTLVLSLVGCINTSVAELTEEQQQLIDRLWDNKHNWEEITGYVNGNGPCDHISFSQNGGQLVFTAYHFGSGNTVSSNSYYVYTDKICKLNDSNILGLFTGTEWNSSYTKDDLTRIYLEYIDR